MTSDIFSVIARRKSSRTYSGLLPGPGIVQQLRHAAAAPACPVAMSMMPSGISLPCIRLIEQQPGSPVPGTYGVIKGARLYAVMGIAGNDTRTEEVLGGIMFEKFILTATSLGIATCWLGGTFSQSSFQQRFGQAGGSGKVIIVSPVGHETHAMRFGERLMRTIARSSSRKPFHTLFDGVEPPVQFPPAMPLPAETARAQVAALLFEAIRLAPSSRNCQPWRGRFTMQSVGIPCITIECSKPDGKFAPLDMGIALCHLFMAAEAAGVTLRPVTTDFRKLAFSFSF